MNNLTSVSVPTKPFAGQKPGTSGLRKEVKVFKKEHYTENFVQSILNAMEDKLNGSTLVIGGDGRYFVAEAVNKIVKMCAANKVKHVIVGQKGIFSTPAVSCIIRKRKATGGIILTASHNPGGPNADFGIKFNASNGGPAPDKTSNLIYAYTGKISEYRICQNLKFDSKVIGISNYVVDGEPFTIEVIDSVDDYVELMKEIFDFPSIKSYLAGSGGTPFRILVDCMNGVTGPYATRIFYDELGAPKDNVVNCIPLPDFGGIHPDPNLTYADDLVKWMKEGEYRLGAAFDGDGDRNMILGHKAFFVCPSDSLAVLAANLDCIPYFKKNGVKGYSRSMPTAGAVDRVAKKTNKEFFEVPTGWKYFGNLLDAKRISLCGEESFGTGSDHIREKDGIWAALAWLQVISYKKKSVEEILCEHWSEYGRNFFTRYDYENCDLEPCNKMMSLLDDLIKDPKLIGKSYSYKDKNYIVDKADNFKYTDPVDGSIAEKQGIRIIFTDGSRIVFRLSGTGSSGATVRLYVDSYEEDESKHQMNSQDMLKPLLEIAFEISKLKGFTGRDKPTVIT